MERRCLGCGRLIPSGSRCKECRPRNGSTRRWRQTRLRILERDAYTCQLCGGPADSVDHITPLVKGGGDEHVNLRAACSGCNGARGARA